MSIFNTMRFPTLFVDADALSLPHDARCALVGGVYGAAKQWLSEYNVSLQLRPPGSHARPAGWIRLHNLDDPVEARSYDFMPGTDALAPLGGAGIDVRNPTLGGCSHFDPSSPELQTNLGLVLAQKALRLVLGGRPEVPSLGWNTGGELMESIRGAHRVNLAVALKAPWTDSRSRTAAGPALAVGAAAAGVAESGVSGVGHPGSIDGLSEALKTAYDVYDLSGDALDKLGEFASSDIWGGLDPGSIASASSLPGIASESAVAFLAEGDPADLGDVLEGAAECVGGLVEFLAEFL